MNSILAVMNFENCGFDSFTSQIIHHIANDLIVRQYRFLLIPFAGFGI